MTTPISRREEIRQRLRSEERRKYDEAYFQNEYWKEDLPDAVGNRGLTYNDPDHALRFEFLASLLIRHIPFHRVIDVGCAEGHLLSRLRRHGKTVFGCDVAFPAVRMARGTLGESVAVGSGEALPFVDGSADLVTCLDVLEHITVLDIEDSIRELARIGTTWVVATINLDNPYEFHPTILSRASWEALFELTGVLEADVGRQGLLQAEAATRYPEYEFFVYRRRRGIGARVEASS